MKEQYEVLLTARNEGIKYTDSHGTYHFNVYLQAKTWRLHLPCSIGSNYESHHLSDEETARILPRITQYLEHIKWFGLFSCSYKVEVVNGNIHT